MKLQHFLRKFDGLGSGFRTVLFVCLTFSYHVRLQNSTLKPIRDIVAAAGDHALVHKRISKYVVGKQEEMKHVRVAVGSSSLFQRLGLTSCKGTIAAAATIGVFSWPDVVNTFWIARAFWFMGMILSFFALISSHQDRLIEALLPLVKANPSVEDTKKAFSLVLWMSYPEHAPLSNSADQVCLTPRNLVAIYVWQSAIMHMSWSWVAFLSGLTLHVIKVFLPENDKDSEKKVCLDRAS